MTAQPRWLYGPQRRLDGRRPQVVADCVLCEKPIKTGLGQTSHAQMHIRRGEVAEAHQYSPNRCRYVVVEHAAAAQET